MRLLFIGFVLTIIAGCANQQTSEQITRVAAADKAKKAVGYQCKKVHPTGTSIPRTFCTTQAQRDQLEQESKVGFRNMRKPTLSCHIGG